MAIQDFTVGQILTAEQLDNLQANDYNQTVNTSTASYVLVALDKGTRRVMNSAGATTITVDDSLFTAGDTLQLQNIGAGVTTVTAGTATVSSAGPLAIPQYGSGTLYFTSAGVAIYFPSAVTVAAPPASALTLVGSGTLSGSSTTFSSVFSATYENYLVLVNDVYATSASVSVGIQIGGITTGYNYGQDRTTATGSAFNAGSTNESSIIMGTAFNNYPVGATSFNINIMNPFLSVRKRIFGTSVTSDDMIQFYGALDSTSSMTDFTILTTSNSFASGGTNTVSIYGYALS
jgi:hypothetical protein